MNYRCTFTDSYIDSVIEEYFPEDYQDIKDTFDPPTVVEGDGPTVSVYFYQEHSIECLRHDLQSDTWSQSRIGHHSWCISGEVGGSTATSYDDLSQYEIYETSYEDVIRLIEDGLPSDLGDFSPSRIEAPQCKLSSRFEDANTCGVFREPYYYVRPTRTFSEKVMGELRVAYGRFERTFISVNTEYEGEVWPPAYYFREWFRALSSNTSFAWRNIRAGRNPLPWRLTLPLKYHLNGTVPFSYRTSSPEEVLLDYLNPMWE